MRIVDFDPAHPALMNLQPRQHRVISIATLEYTSRLQQNGPALTALTDDGRPLACGGVIMWPSGLGTLWVFCAASLEGHGVMLDRCLQRLIKMVNLRRIEATTEVGWVESCQWLEHLRFQREGLMRKYGPDGTDHYLYARVQ